MFTDGSRVWLRNFVRRVLAMAVKFAEFSGVVNDQDHPDAGRRHSVVVFESGDRGVVRTGNRVEGFAGPDSMMENRVRRNGLRSKVFGVAGMTACHCVRLCRGDGRVTEGEWTALFFLSGHCFQVVPSANHLFRDAEISATDATVSPLRTW